MLKVSMDMLRLNPKRWTSHSILSSCHSTHTEPLTPLEFLNLKECAAISQALVFVCGGVCGVGATVVILVLVVGGGIDW